jgi:NTE family protein
MLSNFPVWLFDSEGPPAWPTVGIKLEDPQRGGNDDLQLIPLHLRGLIPPSLKRTLIYARALVETMTQFHDRLYLDSESFARTVGVPTGGVSATNFRLTKEQKQALFASGQQAAKDFLETKWTFGGYVAAFRAGAPKPRRQGLIREAMQEAAGREGIPATPVKAVVPPAT